MSDDLIGRSQLLKEIETWGGCVEALHEYIKKMPTSYNVDKVVKELEKSSKWVNETNEYGDDNGNDYIPLSKAIEIVKQGGVSDDVCEYRSLVPQLGDVYYLTSCEHRHNGMLNGNKCNYCGKKIKVVE